MVQTLVVVEKILGMFLVILVGWVIRRRGYVDGGTTRFLSIFTTDVALPALIFSQMLLTVDRRTLEASWVVPVLAAGVLGLGQIVGWAGWRLFCSRAEAPTFIFVTSIANWIYLPLPIIEALYGSAGVQMLLLCNVGVQLYMWTIGVATLHGGRLDAKALLNLLKNPGLLATVLGIILALAGARGQLDAAAMAPRLAGRSILEGMRMIGSLTIPLSLIVTGLQLGALSTSASRPGRPVVGVVLLRLLVTPFLALLICWGAWSMGVPLGRLPMTVIFLIATMPVAVSCSILAERFAQNVPLAAQSILYTTLGSLITVPIAFWAFNRLIA